METDLLTPVWIGLVLALIYEIGITFEIGVPYFSSARTYKWTYWLPSLYAFGAGLFGATHFGETASLVVAIAAMLVAIASIFSKPRVVLGKTGGLFNRTFRDHAWWQRARLVLVSFALTFAAWMLMATLS